MLNKFTYPLSIILTVVTRTTTENPVFCVLKANQERYRANQLRNVKLNGQFLALNNFFKTYVTKLWQRKSVWKHLSKVYDSY